MDLRSHPSTPSDVHGFLSDPKWAAPQMVTRCEEPNRKDQGNLTASHEYVDDPEVLRAKVSAVADLIRRARNVCAYTGAGLSKASGIPDYATKSKETVVVAPKIHSNYDAEPTYAHHCLVAMHRAGCLHTWVQQNHDGLPQKAGFPQSKINEIHGGWFDPSNPVVPFKGNLRTDLFAWMCAMEDSTDLCLCLGTSLSGMNADRMANTPAAKAMSRLPTALGTVVVNLQKTPLDPACSIRVWCKLDDFFRMLTQELSVTVCKEKQRMLKVPVTTNVFTIPYDATGRLDPRCRMTLDLSTGADVMIAPPTAPNAGATGKVTGRERNGHWNISVDNMRKLGVWWVAEALEGKIEQLPVVNVRPKVVKVKEGDAAAAQIETRVNAAYDAGVAALVEMGFDDAVALDALRKCHGDLQASITFLTSGE